MRILVTGVGGFLGRRLAGLLVRRGHELVGTVLEHEANELTGSAVEGVDVHCLDVQDHGGVYGLVEEVDPAVIVHLAALSHVGSSWNRIAEHFQINLLGTEAVLDAAGTRRVVFASSAEVYGVVSDVDLPLPEDHQLAPANPYAFAKAAAERLVLRGGGVVVRCFNVVGPGQASTFALPTFAAQLVRIRRGWEPPVLKVGNLEAIRDFVHVDDAVAGFAVAVERGERGVVYNLASGRGTKLSELLARMIELAGIEVEIELDPERLRPAEAPRLEGNATRLEALGWQRHNTVDDALIELLAEADERIDQEARA